jgi:23S rRNA (adenine2030-N6)-methyltransferase
MLSYRHAFHAGNHADVLKHLVLCEALALLCAKDKPLWYVDTHAGAGLYALGSGVARGHTEFADGVGRLGDAVDLPAPLARCLELVRAANPCGALRNYPGSPWFADRLLRPRDRLWLHELHPADATALAALFAGAGSRAKVVRGDGFAGLRALLPPQPRRALVMIDPSYEVKDDYRLAVDALRDALGRFATGVYLLWYPLLDRREPRELRRRLEALGTTRWLHASLAVRSPSDPQGGMYGSAVWVLNPPYRLQEALAACGDTLVRLLARPGEGAFRLETGGAG